MRFWSTVGKIAAALLVIALVVSALGIASILRHGLDARREPTRAEAMIARALRRAAVPARAGALRNPVPLTPATLAEGRDHFADHCAGCHANDGSGKTELGQSLYPKSPDMRAAATQRLSDGELFFIIEHGVRLTGMPAWGGRDPADSWKLVHFVRHLPHMNAAEIERVKQMNPVSRLEERERKEEEDFLESHDPKNRHP